MLDQSLTLDLTMRGHRPKTAREYVRVLRPILNGSEVAVPLTKTGVATWIHEGTTASQRRWRYLAMNALCRMLVEDGELDGNPCARIPMPKEQAAPQPILTEDAYRAVLRTCGTDWLGKRDKAILSVLASTGCRRAELVAIDRTDVDVAAGQVIIRQGKGGKWRVAYLDDSARKTLLAYLRHHRGTDALWTDRAGNRLTPNGLTLMLKRRSKTARVEVTAHMFRRRMATNWLLDGGSQVGLMNAAGWSSPAMAVRYTALAAQEIAKREFERANRNR